MIQAIELHKGSLVKTLDGIGTIVEILRESVVVEFGSGNRDGKYYFDELEGISITKERLERWGFEVRVNEKGIKYVVINSFLWLIIIEGAVPHLVLASAELMHDLQTRVQYVHQLQNLYFALTGEELSIKEPV